MMKSTLPLQEELVKHCRQSQTWKQDNQIQQRKRAEFKSQLRTNPKAK